MKKNHTHRFACILTLLLAGCLMQSGRLPAAHAAGESITRISQMGGAMRSVIFDGTTIYTLQEPKLLVIDAADPANPVTLGSLALPGIGRRLSKQGDTLYIACWDGGLVIVDVSDPSAPQRRAQLVFDPGAAGTNCETQDVEVNGTYAYVIDQHAGLVTVDVSDPADPRIVTSYTDFRTSNFNGYDVAIEGERLFLCCEFDGLYIFDISNPAAPQRLSRFPADATDTTLPNNFYKSVLDGDYLYMAGGGRGFVILNVADMTSPELTAVLDNDYAGVISLVKIGDSVYLCTEFSNFFRIDVSSPAAPRQVASFDVTPYHSLDVAARGNLVALANRDYGLRLLDVSGSAITQVGSVTSIGQVQDCVGAGEHAFVACYHQGLQILNVSDPARPVLEQTVPLQGYVNGVAISDSRACTVEVDAVETSGGYLEIIDVSTPADAAVIGSLALPGRPVDVTVRGTTAYVAAQTAGVLLVDIADPAAPALLSSFDTSGSCYSVDVHGDLIVAGDGTRGSLILDARDPTALQRISGGFDNGTVQGIGVWDTHLFSPGGDTGLTVTDITQPAAPTVTGVLPPETRGSEPMDVKAVTVADSYLLTVETTGSSGQVRLFDLADPAAPALSSSTLDLYGDPLTVSCNTTQGLAYASSQIAGLFIYTLATEPPAGIDIDGRWIGSAGSDSDAVGITAEIDQARRSIAGTITMCDRTEERGTISGTIDDDDAISATVTFPKSGTATLDLAWVATDDTLTGTMSGDSVSGTLTLQRAGLRGQLPLADTAAQLSDSIQNQLADEPGPAETYLLQQAGSALDQGIAAQDLADLLSGAGIAEVYLKLLRSSGPVDAARAWLYPAALWDTTVSRAIAQSLISRICPDFKADLQDTIKPAERFFRLGSLLGASGRHALAMRALSRAADGYARVAVQYDQLAPDCPDYDIAAFDGYYEGTIDFGFAVGNVSFCVAQDDTGAITGEAIIEIAATSEKMGGLVLETVNETVDGASVINGYIQVFVGSTEAHVLMIDWQHNPSTDQWEGTVDVDLQPVNATAAVKFVSEECPDGWDEEFAEVTGD